MISGAVDQLTSQGAIGWLYHADLAQPTTIRAFFGYDMIGEAVADRYRPDLHRVGLGDGHCGFEIPFNRPLSATQLPFVKIKPDGMDLSLSLTGNAIYLDLLHAILDDAQGAGRHRSILGGLWTDRVDAGQVLAGRIAVGSCMRELQPILLELISSGYVVLPNLLAPNGLAKRETSAVDMSDQTHGRVLDRGPKLKDALDTLGKLLFREISVRLLRAIFDDHPVIYRLDRVDHSGPFHQAASIEVLPSPAESLLLYVSFPGGTSRMEFLRNSHELAEFGPSGRSRWTVEGHSDLIALAEEGGLSIGEAELTNLDVVMVGPGLAHRIVPASGTSVLRALATPRRVTPLRFLSGTESWIEAGHVSGARIRL